MDEQRYQALSRPFQENPTAALWLVWVNKALTVVGYVAYPALLVAVALSSAWVDLVKFIVVPAVGFVSLSIFRARYNASRPYEVLAIEPIIHKDTVGKSFPSRHTFSMMMIACSWLAWFAPAGIALVACACVMGCLRVLGGVHFPRDVIAGTLFAIACALIGYCVIPW